MGAWGPNEKLRAFQRQQTEERSLRRDDGFDSFARLVNIPEQARRPRRRKQPATELPTKTPNAITRLPSTEKPAAAASPTNSVSSPPAPPHAPEDLRARIEEASELWRTRMDIVRAQTIEKLGLDAEGIAKFDAAVEAMNVKLRDSFQTIAAMLANEESLTRELGVRLMGDVCASLAESYEQISTCVDAARRADVADLELHNFIDPSVAEPLIDVQGKLGNFRFPMRRGAR